MLYGSGLCCNIDTGAHTDTNKGTDTDRDTDMETDTGIEIYTDIDAGADIDRNADIDTGRWGHLIERADGVPFNSVACHFKIGCKMDKIHIGQPVWRLPSPPSRYQQLLSNCLCPCFSVCIGV